MSYCVVWYFDIYQYNILKNGKLNLFYVENLITCFKKVIRYSLLSSGLYQLHSFHKWQFFRALVQPYRTRYSAAQSSHRRHDCFCFFCPLKQQLNAAATSYDETDLFTSSFFARCPPCCLWQSQKNLPLKKSASLNANYFPHETEKVELLECLIANNILKSGRKYNNGTNILFLQIFKLGTTF